MKQNMSMSRWVCYAVGFVFITSGVIKLLNHDFKNIFASLDLPFPMITLFLVAITEIACGALIVGKLYVKQATIPLIIIILGAIYLTKIPIIFAEGFLSFIFQARLDVVMIILLLLIWQHVTDKKLTS